MRSNETGIATCSSKYDTKLINNLSSKYEQTARNRSWSACISLLKMTLVFHCEEYTSDNDKYLPNKSAWWHNSTVHSKCNQHYLVEHQGFSERSRANPNPCEVPSLHLRHVKLVKSPLNFLQLLRVSESGRQACWLTPSLAVSAGWP